MVEKWGASHWALASKINAVKMKVPPFKMVAVADGDFAYRRSGGVLVSPIGCLMP